MTCPHCGYEDGWDGKTRVKGKEGEFYTLSNSMRMERELFYETEKLYACPKCKKTFIE